MGPTIEFAKDAIIQIDNVTSVGVSSEDGPPAFVVTAYPLNSRVKTEVREVTMSIEPFGDPDQVGDLPLVIKERQFEFFGFQADAPADHQEKFRPVPGGVTIGTRSAELNGATGTSAFVMTDGDELYMTSNNHVFTAVGRHSPGEPVVQPGIDDGGMAGPDTVGTVKDFVPMENGVKVDFAWASMDAEVDPFAFELGEYSDKIGVVEDQDQIVKSGRTTGVTRGNVVNPSMTIKLRWRGDQTITMEDVFMASIGGGPGDSGSPAFLDDGEPYTPLGLLFGGVSGVDSLSIFCKLTNVVERTGLQLVSQKGAFVEGCSVSRDQVDDGQSLTISADIQSVEQREVTVEFMINGETVDSGTVTSPTTAQSREIPHQELLDSYGKGDINVSVAVS